MAQLTKSLELEFDDLAVESEAYITWELDGDWDKFEYSFSQGELDDNLFTVYAADYRIILAETIRSIVTLSNWERISFKLIRSASWFGVVVKLFNFAHNKELKVNKKLNVKKDRSDPWILALLQDPRSKIQIQDPRSRSKIQIQDPDPRSRSKIQIQVKC